MLLYKIVLKSRFNNESALFSTGLVPKCPKCGKLFTMKLRSDDKFVEDLRK